MASRRKRTSTAHPGTYGAHVGRDPVDLDAVIDYRTPADGSPAIPITIMDRATETLRLGGFTADVAARCGVRVETVREWERVGTQVLVALNDGSKRGHQLSPLERQCARFVTETARAEADGKALLLGLAEQLSRGGAKRTTTVQKVNAQGQVIENSTKEETTLPDGAMIRWRLERRWPDQFHRPAQVEVSGPGGGPLHLELPDTVAALYAELDRISATTPGTPAQNGHKIHDKDPTTG